MCEYCGCLEIAAIGQLTREHDAVVALIRGQLVAGRLQVERALAEADTGVPADPSWPNRLREVLFLLREHILKEQDGVFPAALASLDGDQWARVDAVRGRFVPRVSS
jgi:hypothetical protein